MRWLDGRTGTANVQAVWFGERPYIITAEGNRYYKGAFLNNGWKIKDIADGPYPACQGRHSGAGLSS